MLLIPGSSFPSSMLLDTVNLTAILITNMEHQRKLLSKENAITHKHKSARSHPPPLQIPGKIYQLLATFSGCIETIRIFNKLLKLTFTSLHKLGYESAIYVDDSSLLVNTFEVCFKNVLCTISLSQEFGFVIHSEKVNFASTHLGFEIDIINMT